jgi:hypothetical protein
MNAEEEVKETRREGRPVSAFAAGKLEKGAIRLFFFCSFWAPS